MGIWKCACMVNEPHSNTKVKLWSFLAPLPPGQYKDRRKKKNISACANTDDLHHLCPLLSLPTSVQNRYFQRQTGAKTDRRHHGRCSDLSAQNAHPTKVGVTLIAFITTITHIAKFHKSFINCTLQSCTQVKGILASVLQTLLTTMRKLRPSVEEEVEKSRKKTGLGNVQTKAFCLLYSHLREWRLRLLSVE